MPGQVGDGEPHVRSVCPHEKHDFFAREELFGYAHRVARRPVVIAKDDLKRTAQHTARRIDFRLRELHSLLVRLEKLRELLVAVELPQPNGLRLQRRSENTGERSEDGGERSNTANHDDSDGIRLQQATKA